MAGGKLVCIIEIGCNAAVYASALSTWRQQHEAEQSDIRKELSRASLAFCPGAAGLHCLLAPVAVEPAASMSILLLALRWCLD